MKSAYPRNEPALPRRPHEISPALQYVVLGVLMLLLAAIFFPVTSSDGRSNSAIACLSNLKQIGVAFEMYAGDNDEKAPSALDWIDGLEPYLKDEARFCCPVLSQPVKPVTKAVPGLRYGYAMSGYLSGAKLTDGARAAQTLLAFETTNLARNVSELTPSLPRPSRHKGYDNFLYEDCHAKAKKVVAP